MRTMAAGRHLLALAMLAVPIRVQGHDLGLGQVDLLSLHPQAVESANILASETLERDYSYFRSAEAQSSLDALADRLQSAPGNERYLAGHAFTTTVLDGPGF